MFVDFATNIRATWGQMWLVGSATWHQGRRGPTWCTFVGQVEPMNTWPCVRLVTFLSYVRRLPDEHKLCSSAINIYSSIFGRQISLFPVVYK
jgi:hypothetical protein